MSAFVDTSAFYALLDADDLNHSAAKQVWLNALERSEDLITSNYVEVETCSLLRRRIGLAAVRAFQEQMLPMVRVLWINQSVHQAGVNSMLSSRRQGPSLVDCTSFVVMRECRVSQAFAFDQHFAQQGFSLLR